MQVILQRSKNINEIRKTKSKKKKSREKGRRRGEARQKGGIRGTI